MKYIYKTIDGIVVGDQVDKAISTNLKTYLNQRCIQTLSTLEGRLHAVRSLLGIKRNVPIFINWDEIYITTHELRSYQVVCLNAKRMYYIKAIDGQTLVYFDDQTMLKVDVSTTKLQRQMKKVQQLIDTMQTKNMKKKVFTTWSFH